MSTKIWFHQVGLLISPVLLSAINIPFIITYCMREFDRAQSGISVCENVYTLHSGLRKHCGVSPTPSIVALYLLCVLLRKSNIGFIAN